MKAAIYRRPGPPSVLEYGEVPDPALGRKTVLIRVAYTAIQGADLRARREVTPTTDTQIVGYQASGTVVAVGSDVRAIAVGDRVVGFNRGGSHAQMFAVDEQHAYPAPEGLALDVAATIPIEFGTASDALFEFGKLVRGETLLIRGGTGGVGAAAVQLARNAGASVIATASSSERAGALRNIGADHAVDYNREDVEARVLDLTDGRGANLVLDLVGGDPLLNALAYRGRYAGVGAASGVLPVFPLADLIGKSLTAFGMLFGTAMASPRVHKLVADLLRQATAGRIAMPVQRIFPLEEAAAAHAYIEENRPVGRILLKAD